MDKPKVCVNVIVKKDGKVIALKRKNQKAWSIPGGHLDFGETIEECAKREVLEETNIEIENIKIIGFTNSINKDLKEHYIMFWAEAIYKRGKLRNKEPDKSIAIKWVDWGSFPEPIFKPLMEFRSEGTYTIIKYDN